MRDVIGKLMRAARESANQARRQSMVMRRFVRRMAWIIILLSRLAAFVAQNQFALPCSILADMDSMGAFSQGCERKHTGEKLRLAGKQREETKNTRALLQDGSNLCNCSAHHG